MQADEIANAPIVSRVCWCQRVPGGHTGRNGVTDLGHARRARAGRAAAADLLGRQFAVRSSGGALSVAQRDRV